MEKELSIEKEFVPHQEALELKELGFDEECFKCKLIGQEHFDYTPSDYDDFPEQKEKEVLIPTFSQAFRWFREKYELYSTIMYRELYPTIMYGVSLEDNNVYWDWLIKGEEVVYRHFNTYEEAELACLRKLIEIVKKQNEVQTNQ